MPVSLAEPNARDASQHAFLDVPIGPATAHRMHVQRAVVGHCRGRARPAAATIVTARMSSGNPRLRVSFLQGTPRKSHWESKPKPLVVTLDPSTATHADRNGVAHLKKN